MSIEETLKPIHIALMCCGLRPPSDLKGTRNKLFALCITIFLILYSVIVIKNTDNSWQAHNRKILFFIHYVAQVLFYVNFVTSVLYSPKIKSCIAQMDELDLKLEKLGVVNQKSYNKTAKLINILVLIYLLYYLISDSILQVIFYEDDFFVFALQTVAFTINLVKTFYSANILVVLFRRYSSLSTYIKNFLGLLFTLALDSLKLVNELYIVFRVDDIQIQDYIIVWNKIIFNAFNIALVVFPYYFTESKALEVIENSSLMLMNNNLVNADITGKYLHMQIVKLKFSILDFLPLDMSALVTLSGSIAAYTIITLQMITNSSRKVNRIESTRIRTEMNLK
ncbi:uncharacterized protein LOC126264373 isoform X2 [Aethina tumida]|uniref:uncharacterized protein LOC126264373 isoform X2 n=1 Tax=Aethina tumida TaxID=116153 RepID=UPI002148BC6A|nr:uncharacterized protein LOC126264373 isoform X2 [Aethina tumida]